MAATVDTPTTDTLFDAAPYIRELPAAAPAAQLSPDARRTARQAQAIINGGHPLGLLFRSVRLHPDADRGATRNDPANLPLRCGSCRHRVVLAYHNRSIPKCVFGQENATDTHDPGMPPRVSHSVASDVRAWWPACRDYSPSDPISTDAARYIPEVADR